MSKALTNTFAKNLIAWHGVSGRSGLPWQDNRDPYAVWVSEIMLQQTQVATVLERYPRFMKRFPTVRKLALADIDEVLAEWAGLGYYTRARNLHACAQQVVDQFSGQFPQETQLLEKLKGIGRSTAGAIAAFAFHQRAPILDANVKRILARLYAIEGSLQNKAVNDHLWAIAENLLPKNSQDMPVYTQALMDFGATWCTSRKPVCLTSEKKCPFAKECQANLSGQVMLFPQKFAKTKSPEFENELLLIRHGNSVLLQKRPSKAIWGGLWSLPESPWKPKIVGASREQINLRDLCNAILPAEDVSEILKVGSLVKSFDEIKHVFTHRRLWMRVWEVRSSKVIEFLGPDLRWVPLKKLGLYGLPQPIKVLLQGLSPAHDADLKS